MGKQVHRNFETLETRLKQLRAQQIHAVSRQRALESRRNRKIDVLGEDSGRGATLLRCPKSIPFIRKWPCMRLIGQEEPNLRADPKVATHDNRSDVANHPFETRPASQKGRSPENVSTQAQPFG